MSMSAYWRPVPPVDSRVFDGFLGSNGLAALRHAFHQPAGPVSLTRDDITALRAMASLEGHEIYDEIANMIEKYEAIEVWGEW